MRQQDFFILETINAKLERGLLRMTSREDVLQYIHDISVRDTGESIEAIRQYKYGGELITYRVEFKGKLKLVREIPDKCVPDVKPVDNTKHDKSMSNRGRYKPVDTDVIEVAE